MPHWGRVREANRKYFLSICLDNIEFYTSDTPIESRTSLIDKIYSHVSHLRYELRYKLYSLSTFINDTYKENEGYEYGDYINITLKDESQKKDVDNYMKEIFGNSYIYSHTIVLDNKIIVVYEINHFKYYGIILKSGLIREAFIVPDIKLNILDFLGIKN
jgi:hypothetical protein